MNNQDQRVGEGAEAYQAGRDVNIYSGMSSEQMTQIMVGLAKQIAFYQAEAKQTVEERLASFREEVLQAFAQNGRGNPEAFRDPDFQYLLSEAQIAYARSGDDVVRDTLVDIISRRSLETERNRMAVTLNDAATKAPLLTTNEFAELSLVYIVRYTRHSNIDSFKQFCDYICTSMMPFVNDISREQASYWHLEAQSCAIIEMAEASLSYVWEQYYSGILCRGFNREQLETYLRDVQKEIDVLDKLIITSPHDNNKMQFNALDKEIFHHKAADTGLTPAQLGFIWNTFQNTITAEFELISLLAPHVPNIEILFDLWSSTPLKSLSLNSVGIAIGHANAVRVIGFDEPLSVWIT